MSPNLKKKMHCLNMETITGKIKHYFMSQFILSFEVIVKKG